MSTSNRDSPILPWSTPEQEGKQPVTGRPQTSLGDRRRHGDDVGPTGSTSVWSSSR